MKIIHWTWEFPQTLLGFVWLLILKISGDVLSTITDRQGIVVVTYLGTRGVSLGMYAFCGATNLSYSRIEHECGHCLQSMILGPLYLLVIGLPSLMWNILKRMGCFKETNYYSFYTEKWADSLGNVNR